MQDQNTKTPSPEEQASYQRTQLAKELKAKLADVLSTSAEDGDLNKYVESVVGKMQCQDGRLVPSNDAFDEVGEVNGKQVVLSNFNSATPQNPQQIPSNAQLHQITASIIGDETKPDESYNADA